MTDGTDERAQGAGDEPDIEPSRLDADAVRVVLRLRQHGYEAYLVGGCVRDLLVGLTPTDFDIATSATPNQVKDLFRNCRLIGRRFRLAHIYFKGGKILEVSTFRATPTLVDEPRNEPARRVVQQVFRLDPEALRRDALAGRRPVLPSPPAPPG